jgi:hypothetical protein
MSASLLNLADPDFYLIFLNLKRKGMREAGARQLRLKSSAQHVRKGIFYTRLVKPDDRVL